MEWQIGHLQSEDVVSVTTSGTMRMSDLQRLAVTALAKAGSEGPRRFLVDHRAMTPEMTTFEIYDVPEVLRRLGFKPSDRVAFVYSPDSPKCADFMFYETRAFNEGFAHRMFTDLGTALNWLRGS